MEWSRCAGWQGSAGPGSIDLFSNAIPARRTWKCAAIQQIALEHKRRYGYRRVAAELRRRGMAVNHKRVLRLMREDNLLAVQPKSFVATTDSAHDQEVYLNLARRMKPTAINQLWVADITYIRLRGEFVYLALVLDAFSRKVVGWALDRTLTARLPLLALERAIAPRGPCAGLVHHSDRGVQYASGPVHARARSSGMLPSMSRPANPYDNASCESFIKTLKREEIYGPNITTSTICAPAWKSSSTTTTTGFVCTRPWATKPRRSSKPPAHPDARQPTVSFSRHGEIYRSWNSRGRPRNKGTRLNPAPRLILSMSLQLAIP